MLQTLYAKGVKTDRLSVVGDTLKKKAWQGGFHEGCIRLYRQAQLLKEAADLIELPSKIEHLPNGTKDTADAAVGSYFNAISSEEVTVLTVPSTPPAVQGFRLCQSVLPMTPLACCAVSSHDSVRSPFSADHRCFLSLGVRRRFHFVKNEAIQSHGRVSRSQIQIGVIGELRCFYVAIPS